MAAKKPGRAESRETNGTTETPTGDTGATESGAMGQGGGARAKNARGTAASATGSGAGSAAGGGAGSSGNGGDAGGSAAGGTRGTRKKADAGSGTQTSTGAATRSRKTAGAKSGGQAGGARAGGATAAAGDDELQRELRGFISQHAEGWGHHEWSGLLDQLRGRGIDTSDTDRIGRQLEQERLVHTLEQKKVSGLGPSKVRSLADRFGTLWSLRHASVDDIEGVSGFNRQLAERVHEALR